MASFITKGQQILQNENLNVPQKKVAAGRSEATKKIAKKGGSGLGRRKALNDITNKSSVPLKVPTVKQKIPDEEFNILEEGFLHDHNKCIDAQERVNDVYLLDLVLPGCDSVLMDKPLENEQPKTGLDSPHCLSDLEELPMADELTDWFKPWSRCRSPCSPKHSNSPPDSPFSWHYEKFEFTLKEEDDI